MNLQAIRPSFNELGPVEQLDFILAIRQRRRFSVEAKEKKAIRAASKPKASKEERQALDLLSTITGDQAKALLALLGE
jgi:hypothetical protein